MTTATGSPGGSQDTDVLPGDRLTVRSPVDLYNTRYASPGNDEGPESAGPDDIHVLLLAGPFLVQRAVAPRSELHELMVLPDGGRPRWMRLWRHELTGETRKVLKVDG